MRLIYHPEAEAELIEAAQFYEARVPQLGARFLDAADYALATVLGAPDRWRVIEADVRRYSMARFPTSSTIGSHQSICAFWRLPTTAAIRITGASVCRNLPRTLS